MIKFFKRWITRIRKRGREQEALRWAEEQKRRRESLGNPDHER